jgi:hypothetical protein
LGRLPVINGTYAEAGKIANRDSLARHTPRCKPTPEAFIVALECETGIPASKFVQVIKGCAAAAAIQMAAS